MLVHRWDLATAADRDSEIAPQLGETALVIARSITAPTNGYGLVGFAYATAHPKIAAAQPSTTWPPCSGTTRAGPPPAPRAR